MLTSRVSRAEAPRRSAPAAPPRLRSSARLSRVGAPQAGPPAHTLGAGPSTATSPAPSIGPGGLLLPHIRAALEPVLDVPLDHVRVHIDPKAAEAAKGLGARAFAYGPHIFLGSGQSPSNLELMAHEVAHVVQQQGAPAVQRSAPGQTDAHEREAQQASASALRGEPFNILERTTPRVQRWGLSSILNYFADKANIIPGFRMFTIIIGANPINGARVERSAANIMRAVVEFIPGGGLITQALDNYGVFDKVGSWVEEQLRTLGMVGSAFKQALDRFLDSLSLSDALHPGDVWERAKRIFTEPIDRLLNFARGLITGILKFIKDAILMPLAKLAEGTRGWDLLIAVLGKNPITGEAVPRTAETLIGGFMKLIGQEEVWENIKKANALARAWAWFQGALDGLLGFVREIPSLFIQALKSLELADIVLLPRAFLKVGSVFGGFVVQFLTWAGNSLWNLLQIIFEVVAPAVMPYLKKVGAAFKKILKDPIAFVSNLVKAGKQGFQQFADRIGAHLKAAFIDWLTGSLEGVYIPKSFEFLEVVKFVLSVLGLTWQNIRQKLVKVLGEPVVKALETTFDIVVTLVKDGPAAAWEKIKEQLTNLKDMVVQGITDFIIETVVKKAIAKIIGFLIPGAAFIQAIITIYDTVMVFIDKLKKIVQVVKAFLDSIMDIANGVVTAAANKVESTLAGLLTLAISFLAGFVGLGKVATKVMDIINKKVRQPIDKALDKVIDWIVTTAKKLFAKLFGKDKKDERTEEQKKADLAKAMKEAQALQNDQEKTDDQVRQGLRAIKEKYKMASLELVVDSEAGSEETVHIEGVINPPDSTPKTKRKKTEWPTGKRDDPIPIKWYKPKNIYPTIGGNRPEDGVTLPETPRKEVRKLQVSSGNFLDVGQVLSRRDARPDEAKKEDISYRLKLEEGKGNKGLRVSTSDFAIDHVRDLAWYGQDTYTNLWPLASTVNNAVNASHYQVAKALVRGQPEAHSVRAWGTGTYFKIAKGVSPPSSPGDHGTNEANPVNSGKDVPKRMP